MPMKLDPVEDAMDYMDTLEAEQKEAEEYEQRIAEIRDELNVKTLHAFDGTSSAELQDPFSDTKTRPIYTLLLELTDPQAEDLFRIIRDGAKGDDVKGRLDFFKKWIASDYANNTAEAMELARVYTL